MRVPIPVVILLCLCVASGVWWAGTRKHDFLSADVNAAPQISEAIKPIHISAAKQPEDDPPQLADYRTQAVSDPTSLVELASQFETHGKLQQSLLAWERVVDSAAPDEARTTMALQTIKRLRPALGNWNTDPAKTIAITLQAKTGKSTAEILTPILEQLARDLEQASSGILDITASVTTGNDIPKSRGPAPIALWFAGQGAEPRSTEVRVFTIGQPEALRDDLLKMLLQIIRSNLGRTASLTVPQAANPDENPLDSLHVRITRLGWLEFGSRLNKNA